jgi:flagellar motor switch protein FliN/FliY
VQEINQADIDALLSAAGASATAEGEAGADAPPGDMGVSQEAPAPTVPDARMDSLGRPFDEAAAASRSATPAAPAPVAAAPAEPPPILPVTPFTLPDLGPPPKLDVDPKRVTMLSDVNLRVRIELGRTRMLVEDVLKLGEGSVVELDKPAGDPVEVYVNDRLVARGEVLVLADNFCVRVSEVLSSDPHRVCA